MARLLVLDKTIEEQDTRQESREMSVAEKEHNSRIAEYRKLLYSDVIPDVQDNALAPAVKQEPKAEIKPLTVSENTVRRIHDYKAYPAPEGRGLFKGVSYQGGVLVADKPATGASVAPAVAAIAADEEDALPTKRTMDTLRRPAEVEVQAEQKKTGVFSAVSTRAKVILAAIVAIVIVAIAVICINTGIINTLNADITTLREQVAEKQMEWEEIQPQIEEFEKFASDPENYDGYLLDWIDEYAAENGMVKA